MDTKITPFLKLVVGLAAIFIIYWGVRSMAFILAPLFLAMVITITVLPLPGWFARRRISQGLSYILTIVVVLAVLALTLLLVVISVSKLVALLPTYSAAIAQTELPFENVPTIASLDLSGLQSLIRPQPVGDLAVAIVGAVVSGLAQVFIVLFVFAFMLSAAIALGRSSRVDLGAGGPLVAQLEDLTQDVRDYVSITTVVNLAVGVGNAILLWVLGVDFALLWGVLSFVMGFIPSIGFWIAAIPPVLLAWAEFGFTRALIVFIALVLINGAVENLVKPRVMGRGLRLSPLVVFVSLIFWAVVLGGLGALIAVPMTLLVQKILSGFEATQWVAALMSVGSEAETEGADQAVSRMKAAVATARQAIKRPFTPTAGKS